jgi:hypothetical protein
MKKSTLAKTFIVAASLPVIAGCVEREVVYQPAPPPPGQTVVVENPGEPPAPKVEAPPPAPDVTFVWIPGAWEWRGNWVWVAGRWDRPHPGRVWMAGHWQHRRHGSVWIGGHWE